MRTTPKAVIQAQQREWRVRSRHEMKAQKKASTRPPSSLSPRSRSRSRSHSRSRSRSRSRSTSPLPFYSSAAVPTPQVPSLPADSIHQAQHEWRVRKRLEIARKTQKKAHNRDNRPPFSSPSLSPSSSSFAVETPIFQGTHIQPLTQPTPANSSLSAAAHIQPLTQPTPENSPAFTFMHGTNIFVIHDGTTPPSNNPAATPALTKSINIHDIPCTATTVPVLNPTPTPTPTPASYAQAHAQAQVQERVDVKTPEQLEAEHKWREAKWREIAPKRQGTASKTPGQLEAERKWREAKRREIALNHQRKRQRTALKRKQQHQEQIVENVAAIHIQAHAQELAQALVQTQAQEKVQAQTQAQVQEQVYVQTTELLYLDQQVEHAQTEQQQIEEHADTHHLDRQHKHEERVHALQQQFSEGHDNQQKHGEEYEQHMHTYSTAHKTLSANQVVVEQCEHKIEDEVEQVKLEVQVQEVQDVQEVYGQDGGYEVEEIEEVDEKIEKMRLCCARVPTILPTSQYK